VCHIAGSCCLGFESADCLVEMLGTFAGELASQERGEPAQWSLEFGVEVVYDSRL